MLNLGPEVALRITRDMPPLDPATEAVIDRHWTERAARHNLFNGRTFCADTIAPDAILGHWTEYRRAIAQIADPGLFPVLRQRGLAVCGVLCSPDGIAVGRRTRASSYLAGLWQLPPAGSVDDGAATPGGADWRRALLAELHEELGLEPEEIAALRPLYLVQHPSGVLDMGIRLDTPLTGPEIIARHAACGDDEYEQIRVLPAAALIPTIEAEGGQFIPTARIFLHAATALPAFPGKGPD